MTKQEFYIVSTVSSATVEEQKAQVAKAVADGATAVEIQLDAIDPAFLESSVKALLDSRTVPVIVSFRLVFGCSLVVLPF